jgi:hypothetical protein
LKKRLTIYQNGQREWKRFLVPYAPLPPPNESKLANVYQRLSAFIGVYFGC